MIGPTITIGALISMIGSAFFVLSDEVATLGTLGVGLGLIMLGLFMRAPKREALVGHLAVVVTFLGMLSSASSVPRAFKLAGGTQIDAPWATVSIALMGVLCLIHVTMSVRWFLARRRSNKS